MEYPANDIVASRKVSVPPIEILEYHWHIKSFERGVSLFLKQVDEFMAMRRDEYILNTQASRDIIPIFRSKKDFTY